MMSAAGVIYIRRDRASVQSVWRSELTRAVDRDDKYRTCRLFRATVHALRGRLTAHEAAQFGAQLPTLIRRLYSASWHMWDLRPSERTKQAFLGRIEAALGQDPNANTEDLVRKLF